jgi:putative membrane protein insertion efficiency factor
MVRVVLLGLIGFYRRAVSPFLPPACRFTPSCSAYAQEAIEKHGAGKGSWIALRRLFRCHPFGGKGYDPVP